MQFYIKTIHDINPIDELDKIGFDTNYIKYAANKHNFLVLKIYNLTCPMATIIKQTALSMGTDAAINKNVLTNTIDKSDLILSGSIKQLKEISKNLKNQPFNLPLISDLIEEQINLYYKKNEVKIVGILNLSKDSFSDGNKYKNMDDAIFYAHNMIDTGADIIDIGAAATNPNSSEISPEDEIKKLKPVICELKKTNIVISVDTRSSLVAKSAIELGADIINDVSGLKYDKDMEKIIKEYNSKIVITHSRGLPSDMDNLCDYNQIEDDVYNELLNRISNSEINRDNIILDVGFGFAKNIEQNFKLLEKIKEFKSLGFKMMAGTSRKRFLKSLVNTSDNNMLDDITMLSSFYLIQSGVDYIRVHNVAKTKLALDFYNAIYSQKPYL